MLNRETLVDTIMNNRKNAGRAINYCLQAWNPRRYFRDDKAAGAARAVDVHLGIGGRGGAEAVERAAVLVGGRGDGAGGDVLHGTAVSRRLRQGDRGCRADAAARRLLGDFQAAHLAALVRRLNRGGGVHALDCVRAYARAYALADARAPMSSQGGD